MNAIQSTLGGRGDAFAAKLNADGSALLYSTYLGGSDFDAATGLAIDSSGNAYVTGLTFSSNFPTINPFQAVRAGQFDAFVSKINVAGSALVFSTYLGGSDSDISNQIAVNSEGEAYVTGATQSTDFPTANALQSTNNGGLNGADAFVTKFNAAGSGLIYSTYLGGSNDEQANSIAVDGFGNAYVAGFTLSFDFPTIQAFQNTLAGGFDAFITKIDPSGSAIVYSTFFGGSDEDKAAAITVDHAGNAFFAGDTFSSDFPTKNAPQTALAGRDDVFVARLNPQGKMVSSTYLGGGSFDQALAIALDPLHRICVAGLTSSMDFPTRNAFQPAIGGDFDAFVVRLK